MTEDQVKMDYRITFGSEQGRRVLAYLADFCCFYKPTYTPGDSHATAFNEGMRNTFNHILSMAKLPEEREKIVEEELEYAGE